jgi:UDP-2,3-diacylglucosamine hydrolase
MARIGILAGGGRLPLMIAESVAARGQSVHIVAIEGEADPAVAGFPHTWVNWGEIGRMVDTLRGQGDELVIAGAVRRPDLWRIRPDAGFFRSVPQIVLLMAGGDDSVLTRVVRFFEKKGLRVRGAHEVAPDLLAGVGPIGSVPLPPQDYVDAEMGFAVRRALAGLDAGQAVVVAAGKVLAIEGAEGTDTMLERVATLAGRGGTTVRRGVLAKGPKPGQELRIDMPAIGPMTIASAVAAHLAAIVVEAGSVLILDRAETVRMAEASNTVVHGLAGGAWPVKASAQAGAAIRSGRVIGRVQPSRRNATDIEMGLAVVERLAPFDTGAATVVARAYILAIEAAEGPSAMLERVSGLRQWGVHAKRRIGALVRRVGPADRETGTLEALFEQAKVQGLAGMAIMGSGSALAPYEAAAPLADKSGLFLVVCEAG